VSNSKFFSLPKTTGITVVGKITRKKGNRYVLEDKRGRQFFVRSVLSFDVGRTVVAKDGLILNIVNDLETFTSFVV
jgi:hypothetical protein